MRTVAIAVDHICKGESLEALDVLVQRLKALETSIDDGGWANAQWMEPVPRTIVGMRTEGEEREAAREEEKEQKRRALIQKNVQSGSNPGQRTRVDEEPQVGTGVGRPSARQRRAQWWLKNKGRGAGLGKRRAQLKPGPGRR